MPTLSTRAAAWTAAATGAAGWVLVSLVSGRREAWDSDLYFMALVPALWMVAGAIAFAAPQRPARVAFAIVGGQAAIAVLQNPTGGLLPLGLIMFAIFGTVYVLPAAAGAWLRRRLQTSAAATD